MAEVVGRLSVKVVPDTRGFGERAKAELQKEMRGKKARVKLEGEFDFAQVRRELKELVTQLNLAAKADRSLWVHIPVHFDEERAYQELGDLKDLLQEASDENPIVLTPQLDEDAYREMRQAIADDFWQVGRDAAQQAADEVEEAHEREVDSRRNSFQRMLNATERHYGKVREIATRGLRRALMDLEAWHWNAARDLEAARDLMGSKGLTNAGYDRAYLAARRHVRRMMQLRHLLRQNFYDNAITLLDDNMFSRVGFSAGRLIAAKLDEVDWRGLGKRAGAKSILGFADGVQRLSGLRIASHFTRDVWRPLADFDRHLPVVASVSSALATAAGAVGALGSNILGLARGVAQMFPALLTLPGALASMGIGAWAVINGFRAMNKMAPEISKAYSGLSSDMAGAFWKARTAISKNLIAIQGIVRKGMKLVSASMGASMGRLAESINKLIGPHMAAMFDRTAKGFAELFDHSDGIAGSIAAMGNIGTYYFPKMMNWVGELADKYRRWIETAIRSGDAFHWIETGWTRMKEFGAAVKETTGFFADLARIAADAGGATLKEYGDGLKKVREGLRRGAQGAETLRKYFKAAHDTFKGFTETVGPGLVDFLVIIGNLAEDVGPKLSKAFGTVIGSLVGGFATPAFQRATRTLADNLLQLADIVAPIAYQSSELVGIFDAINAAIVPFGKLGVAAVGGMLTAIDDLGPSLVKVVDTLGHSAADFAIAVFRPVTDVIGDLGPLLEVTANAIAGVLDQNLPAMRDFMGTFQDLVLLLQDKLGAALPRIASGFGMFIEGVIRAADGVAKLADALIRVMGTGFGAAIGGMATLIGGTVKVLGTLIEAIAKLVDWLVKGTDALGPFGELLKVVGHVVGFGAGVLAMAAGFGVAGKKATALAKGLGGIGKQAAAAGAGMTVIADASDDVGKKSGKAQKGLRGTAGGLKGVAKGVGAAAAVGLVVDGMSELIELGEGPARTGDQLASAFDRAAASGGGLDDVFRSIDGTPIMDTFFGIGSKLRDLDGALRAVEQGWWASGGLSSAAAQQFEEIDMVLSQLDYETASRNFKILDDAIRETGRGSDVARDQMKNYADIIKTQLLTAGLDEYVNDAEKFSSVLRGELDEGLVRTERGFESAATAARKLREEMRMEKLGEGIRVGLDLIPQYAARTMSQTSEEIRASIDGLGQIFVDNMPEIKEYWTQIGGGGKAGASLADKNVKILTAAFDEAQAKLGEFGGNVADYGGSWSKMMDEMYASGGKQAEAAKEALKLIGDALKQTGLDYGTLQTVIEEMDLSPNVKEALLELIQFSKEAPGHIKEGIGAGWLAANEEQRIALAQMAENAQESGDAMLQAMAETKMRWVDGADAMKIPIEELYDRMKNPPRFFDGMDLTYDAKVQILDLMGVEGELRSKILTGALMFNGIDPTKSVSEQMKARSEEVNALRKDIETPVGEMNDPTQPVKTGVELTREQLALMKNGDYHIPELTDPTTMVQDGAYDASVHLQWLAGQSWMIGAIPDPTTQVQDGATAAAELMGSLSGGSWVIPSLNDPTTKPRDGAEVTREQLTLMANGDYHIPEITDPTKKAIDGVRNLNTELRPGLPLSGVDDSKQLQGAYDGVGGKAAMMATKVGMQSAKMKSEFERATSSMSARAAADLGQKIPAQSQKMASQIQSMTTKSASQFTRFSNSARTTASNVGNQYRQMSTNANTMASNTGRSVGRVGSELGRIPGIARGATAGSGSWLTGAGGRIMDGLLGGIRSRIGSLRNLLGSVTSMIPRWKGPPDKDAILLRPAGRLIMEGLAGGLWDSFQTDVKPALMRISDEIANTRIDPWDVDMSARTDLYSAHGNIAGRSEATGGNNVSVTVQYPHPDSTPRAIQRGAQTAAALL